MTSYLLLLAAWSLLGTVESQPTVTFPFNSQLPPVARVGEAFSYALSPQTFTSASKLTYSLNNAPPWLAIDAESGALRGTPREEETQGQTVVGVPVEIVADDGSGSASMPATLVISTNKTPIVRVPLSEQIGDFGDQSAPNSISAYPATPFSFTFDSNTFSADAPLSYYAVSANSSPLPSWMRFDAATLTFSGETPPFESLVQPPQTFDFRLVASDVVGFSAAFVPFSLVVGSRKLTIDDPVIVLNVTPGSSLVYDGIAKDIRLDGDVVRPSDLDVSSDNMPQWLSFDTKSLRISGEAPDNVRAANATITLSNSLSDSLVIQLQLVVKERFFLEGLPPMNATQGKPFKFDLEPYLSDPGQTRIAVDTNPSQDWLELDEFVLSGTPPTTGRTGNVRLEIQASKEGSTDSEKVQMTLKLLPSAQRTSTTSTTRASRMPSFTPSSSPSPSELVDEILGSETRGDSFGNGLNGGQIALAVIVPISIIAALIALFIILRRRKDRKNAKIEAKDISGPVPGSFEHDGSLHSHDLSVAETAKALHTIPPPLPAYRPGQKGYLHAALQRMRSTRSHTSVDDVDDNDSEHSFTLAASGGFHKRRSVSDNIMSDSRNSWLTEEGVVHGGAAAKRQSRNSILSLYDSLTDFPSRRRHMAGQRQGSWRSTLDVTIPSMEEDRTHSQHIRNKKKKRQSVMYLAGKNAESRTPKSPNDASSGAVPSIQEQLSPLGSHPTHGRRYTPPKMGALKDDNDGSEPRDSRATFLTGSGFGSQTLSRQQSRGSDLSYSRPMSRRSDASPWFGGRSVVSSRPATAKPRRFQYESESSSSALSAPVARSLPAAMSGATSNLSDREPNWHTVRREDDDSYRGSDNWRTTGSERDSLGDAYEELMKRRASSLQSPDSTVPPRPPKSAMRSSELMRPRALTNERKWDKSWMGKGVSLRPRPLRPSESSVDLMSPSKWDSARPVRPTRAVDARGSVLLTEEAFPSIRHVRRSTRPGKEAGVVAPAGEDQPQARRDSKVDDSDNGSGWLTESMASRGGDSGGLQRGRDGSAGTQGNNAPREGMVGQAISKDRHSDDEYSVFI